MKSDYQHFITGKVKLVYPSGYGFIVGDHPEELGITKDCFFHVSSLVDKDIEWEDVTIGQAVRIDTKIRTGKGWQANGVMFVGQKSQVKPARNNKR